MNKTVFIACLITLAGCVTAKTVTKTVATTSPHPDIDRMQGKFPGYTPADFSQGKTLYEQHCGTCHSLQLPSSQTEEKWKEIVPAMSAMVNQDKPNSLDPAQQDLIFRYLVTNGSK